MADLKPKLFEQLIVVTVVLRGLTGCPIAPVIGGAEK